MVSQCGSLSSLSAQVALPKARQLAALLVARRRLQFKKAGATTDPLRQEAERWRAWLQHTSTGEPDDLTPTLLTDRAEQIEKQHGEKAAILFARVAQVLLRVPLVVLGYHHESPLGELDYP